METTILFAPLVGALICGFGWRILGEAAATVSTNSVKICPTRSPRKLENATRLIFTASRISSMLINRMMIFFRFRKIPKIPMTNSAAATVR